MRMLRAHVGVLSTLAPTADFSGFRFLLKSCRGVNLSDDEFHSLWTAFAMSVEPGDDMSGHLPFERFLETLPKTAARAFPGHKGEFPDP
jgi:hypothetical protein